MAAQAGVWIDHQQAIVVVVSDAGQAIKKIAFDIGQPLRSTSRSHTIHKYTPTDFVAEDRLERKVENDRKDYYDDVIAAIRGTTALLILGPGEAKGEFRKRIQSKELRGIAVEMATADKMTERQLAAKVREHFATPPPSNSAPPKKAAGKKVKSAQPRKRAKKATR